MTSAIETKELARKYVLKWVPGEGVDAWRDLAALLTDIRIEQHVSEHHCEFTGEGAWNGYNCPIRAALEAERRKAGQ